MMLSPTRIAAALAISLSLAGCSGDSVSPKQAATESQSISLARETPAMASMFERLPSLPKIPAPLLPIVNLLPPLPISNAAGSDFTQRCGIDGVICLQEVEDKLAEWERYFGCDHRAIFPTVYKTLTRYAKMAVLENAAAYDDPAGLGYEALEFYALYQQMITAHLAGDAIPPAWQTTMDAAQSGDWTGAHDMLLAINAHVQRDMPFAIAKTGLTVLDGSSRKPDHDQFNAVLNDAYPAIVDAIAQRYDPAVTVLSSLGVVGNLGAMQLVALWREGVWRNAERLVITEGGDLAGITAETIEQQAQITAMAIKNVEIPGHRAQRDSYCQAALQQNNAR